MASAESLRRLIREHGGKCHYCGRDVTKKRDGSRLATRDHIVPQSEGGTLRPNNLVLACKRCNNIRGSTPYGEFLERAKAGDLPNIRYRLAHTWHRRAIAKTVISETQFRKSKNRKLSKVARSGYLDEIGRYSILKEALEQAGYLPEPGVSV